MKSDRLSDAETLLSWDLVGQLSRLDAETNVEIILTDIHFDSYVEVKDHLFYFLPFSSRSWTKRES